MGGFAVLFVLVSILRTSTSLDTMSPSQSIRDSETLVSQGGSFELGFFSPADSKNRYLGIWYRVSPQTIVWVANREVPLPNMLGALNISNQGFLVLLNSTNNIIWSSNTSRTPQDPVAQLLDSGNLVVRDRSDNKPENYLWQSFDYPCDTLLPGMKLGSNLVTGFEWYQSSWKGTEDPAPGQFSCHLDPKGYPQAVIKKGSRILYRAEAHQLKSSPTFTKEIVLNETQVYFKYELLNGSPFQRYTLNPSGLVQDFMWNDRTRDWVVFATSQGDQCDSYGLCGVYAICEINNSPVPVCACLDGFTPKSPSNWNSQDWTDGCIPRTPLDCNDTDSFLNYSGIKLPNTSSSWFKKSIGLKECKGLCSNNCSCTAYANLEIQEGGGGCLLWFSELIDIRTLSEGGQDIYIRIAASELNKIKQQSTSGKKKQAVIITSSFIVATGMLTLGMILYRRRRNLLKQGILKKICGKNENIEDGKEDIELPLFDLTTIAKATSKFSSVNKLGEGGFGPVYKGTLMEGQEIAVKRLSKSSSQGLNEFKNEVKLIAKLQHRNLVKLLGCCIHEEEKMLIYEYMPNKSLDSFIFDQARRKLLDWQKRIHIIGGIARGLLYLQQDSRLRIIHRDLKASNILLDKEMNPKISDFGLARIFGGDETEANTKRVVGTYGYMSPEYAMDGLFSVKSDVYSFGVLVLEIVSGKKNWGFSHPDHDHNLLGHAWILWIKGTPVELIDEFLTDLSTVSEVLRCIHVALLCVQQRAEERPNMSSVVLMLGSENPLPPPKQPAFFLGGNPPEAPTSWNNNEYCSANEVTMTLEAR